MSPYLRWGEDFLAEEGDEIAEQLFLEGEIALVITDSVTTEIFPRCDRGRILS